MLKKIFAAIGIGLVAAVAGFALLVALRQHRRFDAPLPPLRASTDPSTIARGRFLANGPAHCVECHGDPGELAAAKKMHKPSADEVPLSGGFEFVIPPGIVRVPNITNDESGIGRYSDGELARVLRYGVLPDGEAALPFMPFQNLSDEDLVALLSYLRAQPKVPHQVAPHELNLLGKIVRAFFVKAEGPSAPPPRRVEAGHTVEYGRYLAHSVANCNGCHTLRDFRTGAFIGEPFAGCTEMPDDHDPKLVYHTQNITPSKKGKIAGWSEDTFVARFRSGRTVDGSPMPWEAFGRMGDDDLRALYRYLQTVRPVDKECPPPVTTKS